MDLAPARGPDVRQAASSSRRPACPWFVTLFGRDSLVVSMQGITRLSGVRRRGAAPPVRAAGDRRRPRARHGAGQDPARDPPRRAGPAAHPAVPAVLRHPRRDEPVPDRALVPLPVGRRRRAAASATCPTPRRRCAGSTPGAIATGDGFQEYKTRSTHGYYNQGWKDSGEAIRHADGRIVDGAIATVEEQALHFMALENGPPSCGRRSGGGPARRARAGPLRHGLTRAGRGGGSGCRRGREASTRSRSTSEGRQVRVDHVEPAAPPRTPVLRRSRPGRPARGEAPARAGDMYQRLGDPDAVV